MTTLETTPIVLDDRRLVLQLPSEVLPGEHRVRVEIDPPTEEGQSQEEKPPMMWEGNVLVYGGTSDFTGDIQQIIEQAREDRARTIWGETPL